MKLQFQMPPTGFKRLFYDIETSPNLGFFWSAAWKTSIPHDNIIKERAVICISYKWEGQKKIHSVKWDRGCDKQLLSDFMKVALTADELVAHNGDRFDEPWIRTRCLMHGIEMPPNLNSFDTLKKARTHFRFNSNRLDYLGKLFFDEGKTPMGWGDWVDICLPLVKGGELPKSYHAALKKMVKYCEKDVQLLEDVFHKLQPYVNPNTHTGASAGYGRWSCPKCGDDKPTIHDTRHTKAGMKRHQMKCSKGCGYFTISNAVLMAKMKADLEEKIAKGSI